jgi:hypothetical protein
LGECAAQAASPLRCDLVSPTAELLQKPGNSPTERERLLDRRHLTVVATQRRRQGRVFAGRT